MSALSIQRQLKDAIRNGQPTHAILAAAGEANMTAGIFLPTTGQS